MVAVVVDTDVVSFQYKGDSRASEFDQFLQGRHWIISFATLAELDRWVLERHWGPAKKARFDEHMRLNFAVYYADRTLCRWWADVVMRARRRGRPIGQNDAWLAATALALDVPLVTHNPSDYVGVEGLTVLSTIGQ